MKVVVAGTFGPLHDGHCALFETALEFGDEGVVVGLTSDDLAPDTRTEPRPIPSFDEREQTVRATVEGLNRWDRDVEIRKLVDELGIVTDDPDVDALIVSPETAPELADVNEARRAAGMEPIRGIVVPYVLAEGGERISSTRIVKGEINKHGALLGGE